MIQQAERYTKAARRKKRPVAVRDCVPEGISSSVWTPASALPRKQTTTDRREVWSERGSSASTAHHLADKAISPAEVRELAINFMDKAKAVRRKFDMLAVWSSDRMERSVQDLSQKT